MGSFDGPKRTPPRPMPAATGALAALELVELGLRPPS